MLILETGIENMYDFKGYDMAKKTKKNLVCFRVVCVKGKQVIYIHKIRLNTHVMHRYALIHYMDTKLIATAKDAIQLDSAAVGLTHCLHMNSTAIKGPHTKNLINLSCQGYNLYIHI